MPWRTESVMDQRIEFVMRAEEGEETIAELCREYGISRPTGYLWLHRYHEVGSVNGLAERSRRPLQSPQQTDQKVAAAVLALRDKTGWGRSENSQSAGGDKGASSAGHRATDSETERPGG